MALMKKAIEAGDDVNQLDPIPGRYNRGRPIHIASNLDIIGPSYLKENIPVIKFLFEHGADPRLPGGYLSFGSAIDDMRGYSLMKPEEYWDDLRPFYTEALALMEEAAQKLDGKSQIHLTIKQDRFPNLYRARCQKSSLGHILQPFQVLADCREVIYMFTISRDQNSCVADLV